jgi:hypothetical protein
MMDGLFNMLGGNATGVQDLLSPAQQQAIRNQSVMAMAAALLKASGPSPQRTTLGQALGGAYEAGQGAMQTGQMNAVQQMLLGQKVREAKAQQDRAERFSQLLGGGGAAAQTPAQTPAALTPEQALLAPDSGPVGPTQQRADMMQPPMAAQPQPTPQAVNNMMPSVLQLLSPEQRAILGTMPMDKAQEQLFGITQEAMKFGEPKPEVRAGKTVMVTRNGLGQERILEGVQPYQAPPSEIATLQALGITPTLQGVTDLARARSVSVNMGGSGLKLTPAQEAIDKKFADTYLEWQTGGGSDSIANIAQVGTVLQRLESGQPLTGPMIGIQPDFVLALTNPRAAGAKEQVQEVVQRNLRVVLGAQFTEKEGNQLISRAYNPTLPPEQNAARLRKLFEQMAVSAQQRQAMVEYYEANGTLQGYKGPQPKITDFYKALEERSAPKAGDVVGGFRFKGGNPNDEANWERVR